MAKIDTLALQKKVEELTPEIQEAMKGWKPRFGNQEDIWLVESFARLNKMQQDMTLKLKNARGGDKLASDIVFAQRSIISSLKRIKCPTPAPTAQSCQSDATPVSA